VLGQLDWKVTLLSSKEDEVWIDTWPSTDRALTWKSGQLDTANSVRPAGKLSSKVVV
jgi:hypothetical protein